MVGIALTTSYISFPLGDVGRDLGSSIMGIRAVYSQLIAGGPGSAFIGLVVPPLIFEAMTHIKTQDFRTVFRRSTFLATAGVAIATVVCGLILWKVAGLPARVSFIFAAIISPTDTASVISVFKSSGVPSRLSALLETEAAFNDATAIVIFTVLFTSASLSQIRLLSALSSFILIFGGGVVVGAAMALGASIVNRIVTDRLAKTVLTVFAVYGSYALSSGLGVSGLVAVSIVGLYFGNSAARSELDPFTRETVAVFWEIAAFIGNSIAFLFLGFETNFFVLERSVGLILVSFLAVTVARAAAVYPVFTVFDRLEGVKTPPPWRNTVMLGGMRGALSVALASSIVGSPRVSPGLADTVTTMALGVAFLSITLQAAMLSRYTKRWFRPRYHGVEPTPER